MRRLACLLATLGAATSACSQSSPDGSAKTPSGPATNNAATPTAAAPADWRRLAECSSRVGAVARFYGAVSTSKTGADGARYLDMQFERERAAQRMQSEAERLEMESASDPLTFNPASSEVRRIRRDTDAAIERERERLPFEEFAVWLGRESDRCASLVQPGS